MNVNWVRDLDSSPEASTPKCSHTAGQNCSLHETKSSSRLNRENNFDTPYTSIHGHHFSLRAKAEQLLPLGYTDLCTPMSGHLLAIVIPHAQVKDPPGSQLY